MKLEKLVAKDGRPTLKADGIFIYSKYKPIEDAMFFIKKEIHENVEGYLLVGLGLGYHLYALSNLVSSKKKIIVLCLCKEEIKLFTDSIFYEKLKKYSNIKIVTDIASLEIELDYQVIIPNAWMQVMDQAHPLYPFLMDIKIKQMSYKRFAPLMNENFKHNTQLSDFNLPEYANQIKHKRIACLVSSGPSLNETKEWLKPINEEVFILCVGSALKPLLSRGIIPNAVIITDSQSEIADQLNNCPYEGQIFYLCTADYNTVHNYKYNRCILLQNGYRPAEELADQMDYPKLDTGGSVATSAFSLLEYFKFDTVILFGQDLGFAGKQTHALNSTSGREIQKLEKLIKVDSNNGKSIFSTLNLHSYLKWFEIKTSSSKVKVYNTALQGAKIGSVPFINEMQFLEIIYNNYSGKQ